MTELCTPTAPYILGSYTGTTRPPGVSGSLYPGEHGEGAKKSFFAIDPFMVKILIATLFFSLSFSSFGMFKFINGRV